MTRQHNFLGHVSILAIGRNAAAVVGLTLLTACGGDGPTDPDPNPEPQQTAIQIQNSSAQTVVDVYFSSCSAGSYGEDRYSGALGPGESTSFETDAGCYDIYVIADDGLEAEFQNQTVTSGQTTTVTVTN